MRILYIVNDLAYFRAHRENIACAMAQDGHEVNVAAGDWEGVDVSDWPASMSLLPLQMDKHAFRPISDSSLIWQLGKLIRDFEPDIVHAITIKPILMGALAARFTLSAALRAKIRFVWTFAGLGKIFEPSESALKSLRKKLVTTALRICGRAFDVVATFENPADRDIIVKHSIVPNQKTRVLWGTGLSLERYKPNRPARNKATLVFLMATRLIKQKGVDVYIQAAATFIDHPTQPQFLLAGIRDPSNPDCIEQSEIQAAQDAGHIEFLGAVTEDDMPALHNRCDVFCLPTRLREGFPRSLLEAAACGCALVASDQVSIRQLVKPGQTGWILRDTTTAALVETIQNCIEHPEETARMGQNAASLIKELPVSNADIEREFRKLYLELQ